MPSTTPPRGTISSVLPAWPSYPEEAVFCVDSHYHRVLLFSAAAEALFGWKATEVLGGAADRLFPEHERLRYRRLLRLNGDGATRRGVRRRRVIRATFNAVRRDGSEFPAAITLSEAIVHAPVDPRMTAANRCGDSSARPLAVIVRDLTRPLVERRRSERAAEQHRRFVYDVLHFATEGRLGLRDVASDLPDELPFSMRPGEIPVTAANLAEIRRTVRETARYCGLKEERIGDLVAAAGEASMNCVVHASGGTCRVTGDPDAGVVQVRVADAGSGIDISVLPRAILERGFTTAGTMGQGFKIMLAFADRLWLATSGRGTTIVLQHGRTAPPPATLLDTPVGSEPVSPRSGA